MQIETPYVLINGQRLQTPPIFAKIAAKLDGYSGYVAGERSASKTDEITLGPDEYFVLGDNSVNSLDSRYFGAIHGKSIAGKVFYRYSPAPRKGWVE